jgi:hypothetical protein
MAISRKRAALYLLVLLCCTSTIYFYPFLSSSLTWMRNSHFRYESRTEVKLPFRWISGEGGGLVLRKPTAAISLVTYSGLFDTTLRVHDHGPQSGLTEEQRLRLLRSFSIPESESSLKSPTYPFTSAGLLCSGVREGPSNILFIVCFSSDFRYFFNYLGRKEDIREASEIAKQIIR